MGGRTVMAGVLLGLGGLGLATAAGAGLLAGDLAALPVLVLGVGLAGIGALLIRAGTRAPAPPAVARGRRAGTLGYLPGPAGDLGAGYDDRNYGGAGDPGWSSGGDSGGGLSSGGGGSSGGGWSSGGGGDSGGGGSW